MNDGGFDDVGRKYYNKEKDVQSKKEERRYQYSLYYMKVYDGVRKKNSQTCMQLNQWYVNDACNYNDEDGLI